jgi:hypothetical protein
MDANKAKRLITKIQSFLDHDPGQELSRLERDLLKTYIQQLYDVVNDDQPVTASTKSTKPDVTFIETPPVYKPEPPKADPPVVPVFRSKEPEAVPMEVKYPEKETMTPEPPAEPVYVHHHVEAPVRKEAPVYVPERKEPVYTPEQPVYTPEKKEAPVFAPEKKEQPTFTPVAKSFEEKGDLSKLFDTFRGHDHYSLMPIENIQSAMGLNERIFTLKELFGGDKSLFDETCDRLNELRSWADARQVLINGVARDHQWADMERIKMAEQFLRIVARRYPGA